MGSQLDETTIRIAIFRWLQEQERWNGGIFSGRQLNEGITVDGQRITLKGQTGIWFPAGFTMPISITTSNKGPYELDDIGDDGLLTYAYRGTDPDHRDNQGLRNVTLNTEVHNKEIEV